MKAPKKRKRYLEIIEHIFLDRYQEGMAEVPFERGDIETVSKELHVELPKNLGDLIYNFRYRSTLPPAIQDKAPPGESWIIRAVRVRSR